ncbi:hypothetical protein QFC22_003561 [Naganishia vaughanmartiniae]|uniref:Uncharacterized protein n=1 Tax=Naganishia vaughanmartiniae TaxID=1424756 RepID=A0ACC2X6R5_9TREE|nr:hypothetical protein QFC22_003561 [Naganishia vaughanmartiniae]
MALNLPAPVNGHDATLDSATPPVTTTGGSAALLANIIYPSREIRSIIDKTAVHIAKSPLPQQLEDKIREHQKNDPKFSFLRDSDPFNRYYRYMIERVKEEGEEVVAQGAAVGMPSTGGVEGGDEKARDQAEKEREEIKQREQKRALEKLKEPEQWEFAVELPNVTQADLDILRLTALFVARRGRAFLTALSVKEGRNPQFDFLRPTHSLFGYFNRTVENYSRIINPPPSMLERLAKESQDKWSVLSRARNRAAWEKVAQDKEAKRKAEKEEEAVAFASIDWDDFAVVQTIEFTSTDQTIDLPPPTTVQAMQMLNLNERRMAAMIVEENVQKAQQEQEQAPQEEDVDMHEESEDEETRKEQAELDRARAIQAKALGQAGMKIKKDYVPRSRKTAGVATTICPYCKQAIPETEISEHIRIELLDPKWKEQKQLLDQKKSQAAQLFQNADVSGSLKQLASARTDLFGTAEDEERRKKQEEEDRAARRAKETIVYDGHLASKTRTLDSFAKNFNLDGQIEAIHKKNQLLPRDASNTVGPQLGTPGPAAIPPVLAAGAATPGGSTAFSGSIISAGPSAPSAPAAMLPQYNGAGGYMPYPDQPAFDPSMFGMPSMPAQGTPSTMMGTPGAMGLPPRPMDGAGTTGIHPSRLAAMGGAGAASPMGMPPAMGSPMGMPPQLAGQTRPFEADGQSGQGDAKRPRIEKLPGGQFYPESDWIRMHPDPITLSVRLPSIPDKPEWKLNGAIIEIPDMPVTYMVSTLRDRIVKIVDAPLPMSKMQLAYGNLNLKNQATLAATNLDDGDLIVLSMKDAKKR